MAKYLTFQNFKILCQLILISKQFYSPDIFEHRWHTSQNFFYWSILVIDAITALFISTTMNLFSLDLFMHVSNVQLNLRHSPFSKKWNDKVTSTNVSLHEKVLDVLSLKHCGYWMMLPFNDASLGWWYHWTSCPSSMCPDPGLHQGICRDNAWLCL